MEDEKENDRLIRMLMIKAAGWEKEYTENKFESHQLAEWLGRGSANQSLMRCVVITMHRRPSKIG